MTHCHAHVRMGMLEVVGAATCRDRVVYHGKFCLAVQPETIGRTVAGSRNCRAERLVGVESGTHGGVVPDKADRGGAALEWSCIMQTGWSARVLCLRAAVKGTLGAVASVWSESLARRCAELPTCAPVTAEPEPEPEPARFRYELCSYSRPSLHPLVSMSRHQGSAESKQRGRNPLVVNRLAEHD